MNVQVLMRESGPTRYQPFSGPIFFRNGNFEGSESLDAIEVLQRVVPRDLHRAPRPFLHLVQIGEEEVPLLDRQVLVDPAGDRAGAVDLLPGRAADHLLPVLAHQDALAGELRVLARYADDVAHGHRSVRLRIPDQVSWPEFALVAERVLPEFDVYIDDDFGKKLRRGTSFLHQMCWVTGDNLIWPEYESYLRRLFGER